MSKLLAKLTARGQDWNGIPGGLGPEVTAADVAAAMAGVNDRIQYHLMMIRGADQWPSSDEKEMVIQEIQHLIVEKKTKAWVRQGGSDLLRLGKVRALAECIWVEATVRGCDQKEIWQHIGVPEPTWFRQYRTIYAETAKDVEGRFSEGVKRVHRSVYRDL